MNRTNVLLCLIIGYLVKMCVIPVSISDALVILFLSATFIGYKYLADKKIKAVNADEVEGIKEELTALRNDLGSVRMVMGYKNAR